MLTQHPRPAGPPHASQMSARGARDDTATGETDCGRWCRYTVQISINSKVTKADMVWLEQQFDARGFTLRIATLGLKCHVADFQSAFPQVSEIPLSSTLSIRCGTSERHPVIQQDGRQACR